MKHLRLYRTAGDAAPAAAAPVVAFTQSYSIYLMPVVRVCGQNSPESALLVTVDELDSPHSSTSSLSLSSSLSLAQCLL